MISGTNRKVWRTTVREEVHHAPPGGGCTYRERLTMILKDMRPLAVVEGEGFKEMLTTFQPGYTLLSRRHFTSMMERKYETSVEKLRNELKKATSKISH